MCPNLSAYSSRCRQHFNESNSHIHVFVGILLSCLTNYYAHHHRLLWSDPWKLEAIYLFLGITITAQNNHRFYKQVYSWKRGCLMLFALKCRGCKTFCKERFGKMIALLFDYRLFNEIVAINKRNSFFKTYSFGYLICNIFSIIHKKNIFLSSKILP